MIEKQAMDAIALRIVEKIFGKNSKPRIIKHRKTTFFVRKNGEILAQINMFAEMKRGRLDISTSIINRPSVDRYDLMDGEIFDMKQDFPEESNGQF
ncbi:MAG: hypothetical protein VB042_08635 [Victivallaceae bacterium]|nr:hypothetical protein [Victivallaceae bacterium]